MNSVLDRVCERLRERHVEAVVIGATALAWYGVSRSTIDIDLLVVDHAVLATGFWDGLQGVDVEVRRGDADDPLAGVVRCRRPGHRPVDLVVGRHAWMRDIVERTTGADRGSPPTVEAADLVCLKLFAGGFQDLNDIAQLRAVLGGPLDQQVQERLRGLPAEMARVWARVPSAQAT